jgi:hypothetical protein
MMEDRRTLVIRDQRSRLRPVSGRLTVYQDSRCDVSDDRYDVGRVTIYRWEQANRLPPPDVIMGRRRGRYETAMLAFDRVTTQA